MRWTVDHHIMMMISTGAAWRNNPETDMRKRKINGSHTHTLSLSLPQYWTPGDKLSLYFAINNQLGEAVQ